MISRWTQHLKTDEEKQRFLASIKNSRFVLERLTEILQQDLAQIDALTVSMQDYQSPSWAYVQADRNGAKRQIQRLLKLLNLDPKETNDPITIRQNA